MIEQKIQRENRRRIKKEKREKEGKPKEKKRDKKDKKDKRKDRRSRLEDAKEAKEEQSTLVEAQKAQNKPYSAQADVRRSKREFNYDEDYQESSVFIEPFKLQER